MPIVRFINTLKDFGDVSLDIQLHSAIGVGDGQSFHDSWAGLRSDPEL